MRIFYFAVFTTLMTFVLLLIGGVVNPMGASMACPDWYFVPTCNGEMLPEMKGGVLFEHGHRLWASTVGLLTLILCALVWKSAVSARLKMGGLLALFLVVVQGIMGGVTVLLGLNYIISTLHLLIGIGFFSLLVLLSLQLSPLRQSRLWTSPSLSGWYGLTLAVAVIQLCLGGLVRHKGAILACGNDLIACGDGFWPTWELGKLHMLHRFVGYLLAGLIFNISISGFKKAPKSLRYLCALPFGLVVVQIALGITAVATLRSVPIVVAHTGVGALIIAVLFIQYVVAANQLKSNAVTGCSPIQAH